MILLAPGASGGVERLRPMIDALKRRGLDASAVALPRGRAERAVPVYRDALETSARAPATDDIAVGGQSFGGRVASLLVADEQTDAAISALILLSYPLHAPGKQAAWDERTAHWPRIRCPVLLLSGESDPFARIDLLRDAVAGRLHADARLVTYPGVGHGLGGVIEEAASEIARFMEIHVGR